MVKGKGKGLDEKFCKKTCFCVKFQQVSRSLLGDNKDGELNNKTEK